MPTAKDIVVRKPTKEEEKKLQDLADMDLQAERIRLGIHRKGNLPDTRGRRNRNRRQRVRQLRPRRFRHLPR